MEVAAGTRIADRYVIERALAKGGMGAVYVARDERMGARVALKITAAGGSAAEEVALRFAREAQIGHRLGSRQKGFVRALDWNKIDDVRLYLVMDLVENAKPLDLRHGTLDERVARWRRAAELVRIAHEQGVVHRDLKPPNFLQAPDGSIFLTDFGLAKVVGEAVETEDEQRSLTMTGVGFGTPPYMPPEQIEDAKHADQRADVFALGCMLFEAAVGRLPYPGPTPTGVMSAHMKVKAGVLPAPRPRDVDVTVPTAIDEACVHALELDLPKRAASVATLFVTFDGGAATRLEAGPSSPKSLGSFPTNPALLAAHSGDGPAAGDQSRLPTGASVPTGTARRLALPARPALPRLQRGGLPDLSHVKVGQRYRYNLFRAGSRSRPNTLIYEIREVDGHSHAVWYMSQEFMNVGGPLPLGKPTAMEWKHLGVSEPAESDWLPELQAVVRTTVTIGGVMFNVMIIPSGNMTKWVPVTGDTPTFPGLIKTQIGGVTTMELNGIS